MSGVTGTQEVLNNLLREKSRILDGIADACEKTGMDVVNHARDNHEQNAHAIQRFVSRHGGHGLVGSIQPGALVVTPDEVRQEVVATMEYAAMVELGTSKSHAYPFMYPALIATAQKFLSRLQKVLKRET